MHIEYKNTILFADKKNNVDMKYQTLLTRAELPLRAPPLKPRPEFHFMDY